MRSCRPGPSGAAGRPRTGRRAKPMAKMFRAYSVIQRPKQEDYWLNIGAAFPHEDGEGFNLLLQALPLHGNGKLVLRAFDGRAQAGQEEAAEGKERYTQGKAEGSC